MKILPISDIHTEYHEDRGINFAMALPNQGVDVLVLAGDIGNLKTLPMVMRIFSHRFKKVVYVPGNHECHGASISEAFYKIEDMCDRYPNVHFLSNSTVKIDSYEFIGSTLWFTEHPLIKIPEDKLLKFNKIFPEYGSPSTIEDIYIENIQAVFFLNTVPINKKSIILTHYAPLKESISTLFKNNILNFIYYTDLNNLILALKPPLWIHGHMHQSMDYKIGNTRILCNPYGYETKCELYLNPDFTQNLIINA